MLKPFTPQQTLDLAVEYHRSGRYLEAEAIYLQLLRTHPEPEIMNLLGLAANHTGRTAAAIEWLQKAIAAQPNSAHFYNNLGLVFAGSRRWADSATALERGLQLEPNNAEIHYNLGVTRARQEQWETAMGCFQKALQLEPRHLEAWLNLGVALKSVNRREEAIAVLRQAQQHCSDQRALAINLGCLLQEQGKLKEAITEYERASELIPNNAATLNNLGTAYKDCGEIKRALTCFRRSLAVKAEPLVHSNLILTLLYDPEASPSVIGEEQQRWNELYAAPLRTERTLGHFQATDEQKRLRIGYVSVDLRDHVVGRTLLPVFEAHNRTQFEFVCYSGAVRDSVAERFRAKADLWHNIESLTDAELANQIHADKIDILVDLGLHTAGNRLPAFARKPAPIQVAWLGYPGPSGVEAMDYWLTDQILDPPGVQHSVGGAKPFRLPNAWCCYTPPTDSPIVNPLPALRRGHIAFGCFNNFAKINDRVLTSWARILEAVAGSELRLLAMDGQHWDRITTFFSERGIAPERCQILPYEPSSGARTPGDYLRRYWEVDIALDPFPYNGMTTTCDALWMGVPVLALRGTTSISRASFSLLTQIGFPEWAVNTEDDYVRLAIALADDQVQLGQWRAMMRARMSNSHLLNPNHFASHLETAYRKMWLSWFASFHCRGGG